MVIVQVLIKGWTENLGPGLLVLVSSGRVPSVSLLSQKRHSNKCGKIWYMWLCSYHSEGLWQRDKQDLIFPSDAQLPDHKASFLVSLPLPALHALHLLQTEWGGGSHCPTWLQPPFLTWLGFHTPLACSVDIAPGVSELLCVLLSFLPPAGVLPAWEPGVIWLGYAEVPRLLSVTSVSGIFVNLNASSQKYQRNWGHFSAWTWKAFAHWCSQDCHGEQRLLLIASNAFQVYASFFPLFQMASQSTETSLTDSPNN